jgi:hypothetical protein
VEEIPEIAVPSPNLRKRRFWPFLCKPQQQQVVPQAKKAFPCATWVHGLRNTLAARHRAEVG